MNKDQNKESAMGPIVGIFLIVLVLIVAALYLFASHLNRAPSPHSSIQPIINTSDDVQSLHDDLINSI